MYSLNGQFAWIYTNGYKLNRGILFIDSFYVSDECIGPAVRPLQWMKNKWRGNSNSSTQTRLMKATLRSNRNIVCRLHRARNFPLHSGAIFDFGLRCVCKANRGCSLHSKLIGFADEFHFNCRSYLHLILFELYFGFCVCREKNRICTAKLDNKFQCQLQRISDWNRIWNRFIEFGQIVPCGIEEFNGNKML